MDSLHSFQTPTPAPRTTNNTFSFPVDKVGPLNGSPTVNGVCATNRNFYPNNNRYGPIFADTFQNQFDVIGNSLGAGDWNINLKDYDKELRKVGTLNGDINPSRYCTKWGLWSPVKDRCVAACEALDPFRTTFGDVTGGANGAANNLLENFEITRLSKRASFRGDYCSEKQSDGTFIQKANCQNIALGTMVKYGDIYTGGAKWPRSKAGTRVFGTCDSTVGVNCNSSKFGNSASCAGINNDVTGWISGFGDEGAQFLQGSYGISPTDSRPYRDCLADGTWGPVQNPCINFLTCNDKTIKNTDIIASGSGSADGRTVGTLEGGNIKFDDAQAAIEAGNEPSSVQNIDLTINCNDNDPAYESGTITDSCNITNGTWNNNLRNTCIPKTCGSQSYILGKVSSPTDVLAVEAGKYYVKDTGFSGVISINGREYLGYRRTVPDGAGYTNGCPSGYQYTAASGACPTGEDCSRLRYFCQLNGDGVPTWTASGYCRPVVCGWSSSEFQWASRNIYGSTPTFNSHYLGGNGYIYSSYNITNKLPKDYGIESHVVDDSGNRVFTAGVEINMTNEIARPQACMTGYVLNGADIKVTCGDPNPYPPTSDWSSTGTWNLKSGSGSCTPGCSKDALVNKMGGVAGSQFYQNSINIGMVGKSYKANLRLDMENPGPATTYTAKPNSVYFGDGTLLEAHCATNYIETGDKINGADYPGSWKPIGGSSLHHYYCDGSTWKTLGGCYKPCNSQSVSSNLWRACMGSCSSQYIAEDQCGNRSTTCTNKICSWANDNNGIRNRIVNVCAYDSTETIRGSKNDTGVGNNNNESYYVTQNIGASTHGQNVPHNIYYHPDVEQYTDRKYASIFYYKCYNGQYQLDYVITRRGDNDEGNCTLATGDRDC